MVYAATGDFIATTLAVGGAVFPDAAEFPFRFILPHRTLTHWPYPYLAGTLALWWHYRNSGNLILYYVSFLLIGCLLHIFQDFLSKGGIPLKGPFSKTRGLNFYKIYTLDEVFVTAGLVFTCLGIAWLFGSLEKAYLLHEVDRLSVFSSILVSKVGLLFSSL